MKLILVAADLSERSQIAIRRAVDLASLHGAALRVLHVVDYDQPASDAAMAKMTDWMNDPARADPRMDPEKNPMPFDGKRMIFGGFGPVVEV